MSRERCIGCQRKPPLALILGLYCSEQCHAAYIEGKNDGKPEGAIEYGESLVNQLTKDQRNCFCADTTQPCEGCLAAARVIGTIEAELRTYRK